VAEVEEISKQLQHCNNFYLFFSLTAVGSELDFLLAWQSLYHLSHTSSPFSC
jgi:hypothetical protein